MEPKTEKMALFVDGANLYATARSLGFDIDYKRLLSEFQSRGYLLRAFYYTAVTPYENVRAQSYPADPRISGSRERKAPTL